MHLIHIEVFLSFAQTLVIQSTEVPTNIFWRRSTLLRTGAGASGWLQHFDEGADSLRDRLLEPQKWPPILTTELPNLVLKSQSLAIESNAILPIQKKNLKKIPQKFWNNFLWTSLLIRELRLRSQMKAKIIFALLMKLVLRFDFEKKNGEIEISKLDSANFWWIKWNDRNEEKGLRILPIW